MYALVGLFAGFCSVVAYHPNAMHDMGQALAGDLRLCHAAMHSCSDALMQPSRTRLVAFTAGLSQGVQGMMMHAIRCGTSLMGGHATMDVLIAVCIICDWGQGLS